MSRATWYVVASIVLVVGTLAIMLLPMETARPAGPTGVMPTIDTADIRKGPDDAAVTFVEYGDFQCSSCAGYAPIVTRLHTEYQDRVLFAYRFVPLEATNGPMAAQAAYAAHLQGKFWEMYDLLFEQRSSWQDSTAPLEVFTGYAQTLGLQTQTFVRDATADSTVQFVLEQKTQALSAGITDLPTFLINGQPVFPETYEEFAALLDKAIADAD